MEEKTSLEQNNHIETSDNLSESNCEIKNYYLVDYENVKTHGLDGVAKLTENDIVVIFYSENSDSMTFGLHRRLNSSKAQIFLQKVETGYKNALDFQLSSYLGFIISENIEKPYINYFIVTKDKAFSCLTTYWKRKKLNVSIVVNVSGKSEILDNSTEVDKQLQIQSNENDDIVYRVKSLIKNQEDVKFVVACINKYKTKQGINNALLKQYKDGKKSSEIYSAIRPLIADKKGK